jgi:hypothetical protein
VMIYIYKRSTDGGASFGNPLIPSNNLGKSMNPEISVSNASTVFVVWQNEPSDSKANGILFEKSTNGGVTFGKAINLSNETGNSTDPDIASAFDGRAVGVWTGDTNGKNKCSLQQ